MYEHAHADQMSHHRLSIMEIVANQHELDRYLFVSMVSCWNVKSHPHVLYKPTVPCRQFCNNARTTIEKPRSDTSFLAESSKPKSCKETFFAILFCFSCILAILSTYFSYALSTRKNEPAFPGTAPLTNITPVSGSTRTTSRLRIIRHASPICPGIRLPLIIRP